MEIQIWNGNHVTDGARIAAITKGGRCELGSSIMAPVKKARNEATKGVQCFVFNCFNYKNKVSKAMGISFHK